MKLYIFILILILSLGASLYVAHSRKVQLDLQATIYAQNIQRLELIVKEKDSYIKKIEELAKIKSQLSGKLIAERDILNEKYKKLEMEIEKQTIEGKDRPSSDILKEVFKSLGENQ